MNTVHKNFRARCARVISIDTAVDSPWGRATTHIITAVCINNNTVSSCYRLSALASRLTVPLSGRRSWSRPYSACARACVCARARVRAALRSVANNSPSRRRSSTCSPHTTCAGRRVVQRAARAGSPSPCLGLRRHGSPPRPRPKRAAR